MNQRRDDHRDHELPETAARLERALERSLGAVEMDGQTRARHLHSLRAHAASLDQPPEPVPARRRGASTRRRALATGIATAVMLSAGTGVAAASSGALPGESLYPVKRFLEQVVLAIPSPTDTVVERRLRLADRRLDELEALDATAGATADDQVLGSVIDSANRLLEESESLAQGTPALESTVQQATAEAHERLAALLAEGLPAHAAERARKAIGTAGGPQQPPGEGRGDRDAEDGNADPAATPQERDRPGDQHAGPPSETPRRSSPAGSPDGAPGGSPDGSPGPSRRASQETGSAGNPSSEANGSAGGSAGGHPGSGSPPGDPPGDPPGRSPRDQPAPSDQHNDDDNPSAQGGSDDAGQLPSGPADHPDDPDGDPDSDPPDGDSGPGPPPHARAREDAGPPQQAGSGR